MAARPNERKAPRKEGELAAPQSRGRSCGPCGLLDRPRAYKRQNGADDAGDCRECYSPQTEQSGSARQEGCEDAGISEASACHACRVCPHWQPVDPRTKKCRLSLDRKTGVDGKGGRERGDISG